MQKITHLAGIAAAALLCLGAMPRPALAQANGTQPAQPAPSTTTSTTSAATATTPTTSTTSTASTDPASTLDTLAAAARKAKEQKKAAPQTAKVFTNENLPTDATISSVGVGAANASSAGASTTANADKGEAYWRDKLGKLHAKLGQDQSDLDVAQRELGVLNLQGYSDPNVAMQQSFTHSDIDKKTAEIEAKKKAVAADQQAISDAESDMIKSGGAPGWAR